MCCSVFNISCRLMFFCQLILAADLDYPMMFLLTDEISWSIQYFAVELIGWLADELCHSWSPIRWRVVLTNINSDFCRVFWQNPLCLMMDLILWTPSGWCVWLAELLMADEFDGLNFHWLQSLSELLLLDEFDSLNSQWLMSLIGWTPIGGWFYCLNSHWLMNLIYI